MSYDQDPRRRAITPNPDLDPTRARPQPWFAGNGKLLAMVVLTLCAVLLGVRGLSMVWLAEEAWAWWKGPPPPRPAIINLRPSDGRVAISAKPRQSIASVFSANDYPPEALRSEQQGRTVAMLTIAPDGSVAACAVQESSGAESLDRATCERGVTLQFDPARDSQGQPLASSYRLPVRWQLPQTG